MTKFRPSFFLMALAFCMPSLSQTKWSGLQVELSSGYRKNSVDNEDLYGVSSGGITSLQNTVSDSSNSNASYALGLGYGIAVSEKAFVTLGLDYFPQTWNSANFEVGTTSAYYKYKNQFNLYAAPGWMIGDNALLYSKLGYATISAQGIGSNPFDGIGNPSKYLKGYVVSLGVKYAMTPKVYVLGDYAYTKFNKAKISGYDSSTTLTDYINTGLTSSVLSIGLGVKFQ